MGTATASGASTTSGRSASSSVIRWAPPAACWNGSTTSESRWTAETIHQISSKKATSEPTDSSPRIAMNVPAPMVTTSRLDPVAEMVAACKPASRPTRSLRLATRPR